MHDRAAQVPHFILHAALLTLTLLALSLWHRTSLVVWTPQALAVLAITYILFSRFIFTKWLAAFEGRVVTIESLVALVITVELIELTGGIGGPLSWLAYLLIVWLTLQLETPIAVITGLGLTAFFLPATSLYPFALVSKHIAENSQGVLTDVARLAGLLCTIPLALYIGHRHLRRKTSEKGAIPT